MKTLDKKLSKQHFRYLGKAEISNPIEAIKVFYESETSYASWKRQTALFLQAGLDLRLKISGLDYTHIGQRLIKHIELAYVIYRQARLKHFISPKSTKIKTIKEMFHFKNQTFTYGHAEIIQLFFCYQRLEKWRTEIDYIAGTACNELKTYFQEPHEDSLLLYIYITHLVEALHQIYLDGGLKMAFPSCVTPEQVRLEEKEANVVHP